MADRISKVQRSINMSHIRGKENSLEKSVRHSLFIKGFRYRKNDKRLPGTPDIVLKKYKTCIFINGCFWHHHSNCKLAYTPKSNTEFWMSKFEKNALNDKRHYEELTELGYHVITVWECNLKESYNEEIDRVIDLLSNTENRNNTLN